jgi:hypothetical protein
MKEGNKQIYAKFFVADRTIEVNGANDMFAVVHDVKAQIGILEKYTQHQMFRR